MEDRLAYVLLVRVYMRGKTHTIQLLGSGFDVTGNIYGSYLSERCLISICIQQFFFTFKFPSMFKAL